jgi:hypothetical protein
MWFSSAVCMILNLNLTYLEDWQTSLSSRIRNLKLFQGRLLGEGSLAYKFNFLPPSFHEIFL